MIGCYNKRKISQHCAISPFLTRLPNVFAINDIKLGRVDLTTGCKFGHKDNF